MSAFSPFVGLLTAALLAMPLALAAAPNSPEAEPAAGLAQRIFEAWQQGEKTGDYTAFKAFLGPEFRHFSYPLAGQATGAAGLAKLHQLIAEREKTPNNLTFSRVELTSSATLFSFQFDSVGTVSGGFPYEGFNSISLRIEHGRLTGFQEYFGYVNPAWFQK
ncbi:nuclear transport factor 2-like protein [Hymenobacter terrenus]|uniref:hypothetical protein n=1 Tax=Hymenobacter terrenus TaxID=1629124 RepID=UPI000619ADF2|nr:hypothetical protein [Hymenobacter terrenus]